MQILHSESTIINCMNDFKVNFNAILVLHPYLMTANNTISDPMFGYKFVKMRKAA